MKESSPRSRRSPTDSLAGRRGWGQHFGLYVDSEGKIKHFAEKAFLIKLVGDSPIALTEAGSNPSPF
jgi:hypothetical protein